MYWSISFKRMILNCAGPLVDFVSIRDLLALC